ncbi:8612_t:CDS:2 [Cetraspora pellucida]|uniref:8612_t:CDS:1 n=1 Tax=Cetraspora pellucida TaxID=1433469 RepID=A0A9N9BHI0_9GLOM|nr:8612_t:CDS:2 [Cetraspora pellucida]
MVSHVSLLVFIISVKNSCLCSNGLAKYKLTKELTQTIRFKYFFPADQLLQTFANRDLVFISSKFIVENSELCFTIAYSSIVDNENSNCEFVLSNVPVTIPYSIYFVTVTRQLKNVGDFIYFGAKTIQYNSVTDAPSIINIIDDNIDSTITKAPQNQYCSLRKSVNPVNANVEATLFYYQSDEKQSDHENRNESNNENAIKEIAKEVLAEFRDIVDLNELCELPCTVCSEIYNNKDYKKISLQICHSYDNYLQKCMTSPLSLANDMWIGSILACLQDLSILEQLLISPGEIPEALTVMTTVVDIDFCETEHYTGYTCNQQESNSKSNDYEIEKWSNINKHNLKDFISNNSINNANELRPSGIIDVNDILITRKELTLLSFKKLVDNPDYNTYEQLPSNENVPKLKDKAIQSHILNVPHSNKLLNEYENLTLLLAGFSVLFTYDVSGHKANLISSLKPEDIDFAVKQVQDSQLISNPAVNELLKNVNSAASERARLAHLDSTAVTKYFHVIIQAIIDTLIRYKRKNDVKYQDRGTSHCHMLVWLHGAHDPLLLCQKLKTNNEFCKHLLNYVSDIVCEVINYLLKNEIINDITIKTKYEASKMMLEK